tara:strand:- start:92897 stop:94165 length:1269 start_codon:yes stop_codon:yes gene_type:complete
MGMSGLNRTLGFPMLIFYGTGMILGAGIYSIIGKAAQVTGTTLWLGFLFAGISALLTALSYAELSAMYPKAGAEFIYLGKAFNNKNWIGASIGIAMALSGAATATTVALSFAGYINQFFVVSQSLVAACVLIFFTGIALMGIRQSGWATVMSTLIEVSGLIFIIYLGVQTDKLTEHLSIRPNSATLAGSALIIFSFFGFESIANLAEESKKPEQHLPWAIILSVLISTTLYLGVSVAVLALLSVEQLAQSQAPLMAVAQTSSAKAGQILGTVALFSTANTALISLIGASRILYSMGKEGALPNIVAKIIPTRKTPWIASLIILAAALLLLPLGKLEVVASISALATMLAFFSVNVALIILRYRQSTVARPFKVPLSIGKFPLLPFIAAGISLVLMTQFDSIVYTIGGTLLVGAAMAFKLLRS